jgi:hypothetical protein
MPDLPRPVRLHPCRRGAVRVQWPPCLPRWGAERGGTPAQPSAPSGSFSQALSATETGDPKVGRVAPNTPVGLSDQTTALRTTRSASGFQASDLKYAGTEVVSRPSVPPLSPTSVLGTTRPTSQSPGPNPEAPKRHGRSAREETGGPPMPLSSTASSLAPSALPVPPLALDPAPAVLEILTKGQPSYWGQPPDKWCSVVNRGQPHIT